MAVLRLATLIVPLCVANGVMPGGRRVTIAPGVDMPVISNGYVGADLASQQEGTLTWLQAGGRGIDTAHGYHNQQGIGAALSNTSVPREEIFVTTKIPCARTAEKALALVKEDLAQLGTYADLLIIHGVGDVKPTCAGNPGDLFCMDAYHPWSKCCQSMEEIHATYHGLELALEQGLVRSIGVSNFQPSHLESLLTASTVKPAIVQSQLYVGHHDDATLQYVQAHEIQFMAYSPLGPNEVHPKAVLVNPVVQKLAEARNVTAAQLGLAWVLQRGAVLTTATSSEKHSLEDLAADELTGTLTEAEMETLDAVACKYVDGPACECNATGEQIMQCDWGELLA